MLDCQVKNVEDRFAETAVQGEDAIEKSLDKSGAVQKLHPMPDRGELSYGGYLARVRGCPTLDRLLPVRRMYEVQDILSQSGGRIAHPCDGKARMGW